MLQQVATKQKQKQKRYAKICKEKHYNTKTQENHNRINKS